MNDGERFLREAIDSVRRAVADRNWIAALAVALTLPDICGKVEEPDEKSGERYARWFDAWLGSQFDISGVAPDRDIRLTGRDCYALRCAFLHEGRDIITGQKAQEILDGFIFVHPPEWGVAHLNAFDSKLQLQVDAFCLAFCDAVERWLEANSKNERILMGLGEHARIWHINPPIL